MWKLSVSTWCPKWKIPCLTSVTGYGQTLETLHTITFRLSVCVCMDFAFQLGFLMPGRSPDIYANIPNLQSTFPTFEDLELGLHRSVEWDGSIQVLKAAREAFYSHSSPSEMVVFSCQKPVTRMVKGVETHFLLMPHWGIFQEQQTYVYLKSSQNKFWKVCTCGIVSPVECSAHVSGGKVCCQQEGSASVPSSINSPPP